MQLKTSPQQQPPTATTPTTPTTPTPPPPPPPVGDSDNPLGQQEQQQQPSQCRNHKLKNNVKDEIPRCQCLPTDQCKNSSK